MKKINKQKIKKWLLFIIIAACFIAYRYTHPICKDPHCNKPATDYGYCFGHYGLSISQKYQAIKEQFKEDMKDIEARRKLEYSPQKDNNYTYYRKGYGSYSSGYSSRYDVDDYDNGDDFADDWADKFYDWDDAYDYWGFNH